jgi:hypothetical protein
MFIVEGGLVYLDSPIDGGLTAYEDEFSALELCRNYQGLQLYPANIWIRR